MGFLGFILLILYTVFIAVCDSDQMYEPQFADDEMKLTHGEIIFSAMVWHAISFLNTSIQYYTFNKIVNLSSLLHLELFKLFRHGDRNPVGTYPKNPHAEVFRQVGRARLTQVPTYVLLSSLQGANMPSPKQRWCEIAVHYTGN